MANKKTSLKEYLQNNSLPIILQVVALLAIFLNLWLASRLAPLSKDILVVSSRVSALEKKVPVTERDHDDIQIIKEQVIDIRRDMGEIKSDLKFLINER